MEVTHTTNDSDDVRTIAKIDISNEVQAYTFEFDDVYVRNEMFDELIAFLKTRCSAKYDSICVHGR